MTGEEQEQEAPVSIASLRSRFEQLSAGNTGQETAQRPAKPKISVSRPRTPPGVSRAVPGTSDYLHTSSSSQPRSKSASPASVVAGPSTSGAKPASQQENSNEEEGEEARPVSVKAMKDRFAGGAATSGMAAAAAGPSKPKPAVPAKSPLLSSRPADTGGPTLGVPSIKRMSTGGTVSTPNSPKESDVPVVAAGLTRTPSTQSLSRSPSSSTEGGSRLASRPPSRGPSPKPPEPSRANKPAPRRTPSPQPTPAQVEPSAKAAPSLPVRKQSLPPEALSQPPPIPSNRPTRNGSIAPASTTAETPRLPERPRSQTIGGKAEPALPPRLPQRQATVAAEVDSPPRMPPRQPGALPPRPDTLPPRPSKSASVASVASTTSSSDVYQPPPPPTRSGIASVSATPPRRAGSVSLNGHAPDDLDDDDEDDEEGLSAPVMTSQAQRILDEYPDSTNANRRPPSFVPDVHVHPTHQIHAFAVHGRHVCTAAHHVKVYDTLMSNQPILVVDLRDTGLEFRIKEPRVTAMCFRPASKLADEGRYLWCGTKDGHLWELDIRTGEVTDTRQGAHGSAVAHILRYRQYLMTLEENGKLHVFEVDRERDGPPTLLRTVRVSDRYTFARMIGNKLWTASAPPNRSTTNIASKGPTIRVYEPCAPGSMPPAKTLYATEWTGAVTSATYIPFRPSEVYLAHEGGYISIWDTEEYTCLQVLKISSTDILACEGVGERLWTGNRKGQIQVYDISEKPWKTTNTWIAHHEQAIHQLHIDFRAIEDSGRFALWSCTKESLRAWDGLLSVDWIDQALVARQPEYCTYRELKAMICTWNIDSAKPHDLIGENARFLDECLNSVDSPDIIVFGFQEVIPLTDKKLTAKTLLFGGNKKESGSGDKVTMAYRHWIDKLSQSLRTALPGTPYIKVHSESLVGLMTCIFVKSSEKDSLRGLDITTVKRGIGGIYGNKGAIVARMIVDHTSLCFINVHLAAGQSQKAARNADLAGIMEDKAIFPEQDLTPFVHGGDGTGILDHELVILNGDLNYRIDQRRENVISSVHAGELDYLLEHDQLRKEMRTNHAFRLRSFEEAPITFAPTYKYNSGTNDYDSSEKRRIPAWCDRILFRKCPNVECIDYRRYEPTVSDHKPVSAGFSLKVKSVNQLQMGEVKQELRAEWAKEEAAILERIMKAMPDIL